MTTQELLSDVIWREENANNAAVGTFKDLFSDYESLLVKNSKNGATRATIMIKKDGKVANITCSEPLTKLVRANKLGMNEIAGFPVLKSDGKGIFVGLPSSGWVEVRSIEVKDYVAAPISMSEMIA